MVDCKPNSRSLKKRICRFEPLEGRQMLAADPYLFDMDSTGWHTYWNQTSEQWSELFATLRQDSIPVDIEVYDISGEQRVSSVWHENSSGRRWAEWHNLTSEEFSEKWQEYRDQGYRLIDQETYLSNGNTRYAGIWVENTEGYAWASYRNMSAASYQAKVDEFKDSYMPTDVDVFVNGNTLLYSVIFVESTPGLEWSLRSGLTSEEFSQLFNEKKDKFRFQDFDSYRTSAGQRYVALWIEEDKERGWFERRDMSYDSFFNYYHRYRDLGYRMTDIEVYETSNGTRYGGVWRQNSDRPNWHLRTEVEKIVQDYVDEEGVTGLGVAIVRDGRFEFSRGYGFQDEDEGIWYSAKTLNRLASVSKAIAGTMLVELESRGNFDLDDLTSSHIATLPNHHSHTLEELLSMRGGVGHYDELGLGNVHNQYNSALDAAALFWDEDLVDDPGSDYSYSTHGYTLLAAAVEESGGFSIQDLVEYYADLWGLSTLRAEDRSQSNAYRSRLYNANGDELSADNISWKVLGGGLESSVEELAKFGMKLIDGELFDEETLSRLMTPPDNSHNFALGWNTGSKWGETVYRRYGSQRGANTHIYLLPGSDVVIALTTNRANTSSVAEIGTLADDLAELMLDRGVPTWRNFQTPNDVNNDGSVGPVDALIVINDLNKNGNRRLPSASLPSESWLYLDPSGDGSVTPLDALLIINHLNSANYPEGEPTESLDRVHDNELMTPTVLFDNRIVNISSMHDVYFGEDFLSLRTEGKKKFADDSAPGRRSSENYDRNSIRLAPMSAERKLHDEAADLAIQELTTPSSQKGVGPL